MNSEWIENIKKNSENFDEIISVTCQTTARSSHPHFPISFHERISKTGCGTRQAFRLEVFADKEFFPLFVWLALSTHQTQWCWNSFSRRRDGVRQSDYWGTLVGMLGKIGRSSVIKIISSGSMTTLSVEHLKSRVIFSKLSYRRRCTRNKCLTSYFEKGWRLAKSCERIFFRFLSALSRENENERRNANESRQQSDVELVKLQSFFIGWKEGEKRWRKWKILEFLPDEFSICVRCYDYNDWMSVTMMMR